MLCIRSTRACEEPMDLLLLMIYQLKVRRRMNNSALAVGCEIQMTNQKSVPSEHREQAFLVFQMNSPDFAAGAHIGNWSSDSLLIT